ncbi:hypothetical protein ETAE_0206 [Edwardsiella piscicida]|uniref:Uncharacterized protein n=2 Tax=Edwardsiella TaxID=635 RepID=A0A0H3DP30_EDWTF|nr:hypothetical protein ETAE_0206 [Edwardsiella tarda EIB202]ADM40300.1 hypothetical protein ETAF_0177 [Edwardsiella tarda FL6-60]
MILADYANYLPLSPPAPNLCDARRAACDVGGFLAPGDRRQNGNIVN